MKKKLLRKDIEPVFDDELKTLSDDASLTLNDLLYLRNFKNRELWLDGEIDATINSVDEDGDMWRIIAYSSNYYKDLPRYISRDAMVISSRSSGLIIDNECMTTRKGKPGVMVRQKTGDYKFVPVNVEASDGVQSVVSDTYFINEKKKMVNTVEIYDEILKDPGEGN